MAQRGDEFGLAKETQALGLAGKTRGEDHLQRDDTIKTALPGAVDHSHAAATEFIDHLVVANLHPRNRNRIALAG